MIKTLIGSRGSFNEQPLTCRVTVISVIACPLPASDHKRLGALAMREREPCAPTHGAQEAPGMTAAKKLSQGFFELAGRRFPELYREEEIRNFRQQPERLRSGGA